MELGLDITIQLQETWQKSKAPYFVNVIINRGYPSYVLEDINNMILILQIRKVRDTSINEMVCMEEWISIGT